MTTIDKRVIACNLARSSPTFAIGASAYVSQYKINRVQILGRSRSGRWVERWEGLDDLCNFRFKAIPAENPFYSNPIINGLFEDADLKWLGDVPSNCSLADRQNVEKALGWQSFVHPEDNNPLGKRVGEHVLTFAQLMDSGGPGVDLHRA
jgi:hypothetical protein